MSRILLPLLGAVTLSLGLAACESEIDGKTAAEVADVTDAPAAQPEQPTGDAPDAPTYETRTVAFDGGTSKVQWVGAKVTRDHDGGFKDFQGTAKLAGDRLSDIDVEIALDSVFTDSEKLTGHLKSDDFFDVARFSKATFESTSVVPAQGDGGTHKISGVLDFHGMKKEITFPADVQFMQDGSAKATAEFTINRKDWGVVYTGKPDDLIKDDVLVKLDINLAE